MKIEIAPAPPCVGHSLSPCRLHIGTCDEIVSEADPAIGDRRSAIVTAKVVPVKESDTRARAIYAAVAGAQLFARGRSDIALFDTMIDSYRSAGLLPV